MPKKTSKTDQPADPGQPDDEDLQALSFEDAIAELEGIVEQMEQGELSLQDSLQAYQRGAALVTRCRGALDSVNQQVRVLEENLLKPLDLDEINGELS
jgi:exodeoxyribonuclease VII small subunit